MKKTVFFLIGGYLLLLLSGCTEKYPSDTDENGPVLTQGNCVACHTDQDLLKQVADPVEPPEDGDSGEG